MTEWKSHRLGDIAKWSSGGTPTKSKPEFWGGDLPWISAKSMDTNRYSSSHLSITELGLKNGSRLAVKDSILLLVRGSILHQKIQVGIATRDVAFNQDVKALKVDESIIEPWYLLLWFMSKKQYLLGLVESTGIGAGKLDTAILQDIPVSVPPVEERQRILSLGKSLDDKIELNRQMNETLESMAQALFKSWFVDFDPVIDNALAAGNPIPEVFAERAKQREAVKKTKNQNGSVAAIGDTSNHQQLFPAEFDFTEEMGWIPKGWTISSLSEIADHVRVNAKVEDIKGSERYVGLEHIGRKDIFLNSFGLGEVVSSNKSRFNESDILFGKLRPYFHKVCITPFSGVCSTDILVFRAKHRNLQSYLAMLLFSDELVGYVNLRSTGTRMPRASAKDILAFPAFQPSEDLIQEFEKLVVSNFSRGIRSNSESQALAKLRDTLLPKLLSGELRIPDAEKLVQEATATVAH